MKKIEALPLKVAVRIRSPRLFIFNLCLLIQSNLNKKFCHQDLLDFLETNDCEIFEFTESKIPPLSWLIKLDQTQRGTQLLEFFDIWSGYKGPLFQDSLNSDSSQEMLLEETELNKLDREEAGPPIVNDIPLLSGNDIDEYLLELNRIALALASEDQSIGELIADNKRLREKSMNKIMPEEKELLLISMKYRLYFLDGVREFLESFDGVIFEEIFSSKQQEQFKKDGVVPEDLIAFVLSKENGVEFLTDYQKLSSATNVLNSYPPLSDRKLIENNDLLVSKKQAKDSELDLSDVFSEIHHGLILAALSVDKDMPGLQKGVFIGFLISHFTSKYEISLLKNGENLCFRETGGKRATIVFDISRIPLI